jgi:dihydroorotate dehydrogenase electron transfer subunit
VRVASAERLGGLALIRLEDAPDPGEPGRFHMVGNPRGRDYLPRPIGLIDLGDGVGFLAGADALDGDLAGPELDVLGPLGVGFDLSGVDADSTLLVAGGFGLTVFPGVVAAHPGIRLISGFRQDDHAVALDLVRGATCDAPAIAPALVTEPLAEALASGRYRQVLAAGPAGLGAAVARMCAEAGVASQIALEAPMACGVGGCFGCAVEIDGTWKRCCVEGPVVAGERLVA